MKYIVLSSLMVGLLSACSDKPKEPTLPTTTYVEESRSAGQPVEEVKPQVVVSSEPAASAPAVAPVKEEKKETKPKNITPKEVNIVEKEATVPKETASDSVSEIKVLKHARIIAKKKDASGLDGEPLQTSLLSVNDGLVIVGK